MEVAQPCRGTVSRSRQRVSQLPLRPLVEEERSRSNTPNHLLESKFYGKLRSNNLIQAEPAEVHFSGFELGKKYRNTLQLINVSNDVMNIHILPTQTKYFQTTYTKKNRLIPGLAHTVKIQFSPDEWRYFYDCIRVHCKGEENLLIPVHAYPVINDLHIPLRIDLPATALQQSISHAIPLRCSCPIDFEFRVFIMEPSQAFSIHPLTGLIPANGQVDIVVTFTPQQYETAQITFKLLVSQFNSKPYICTVTGSSNPNVAISQVEKKLEHKDPTKATAPASHVVARSKTWPSKVPVKSKMSKDVKVSKPQMNILTHGGVAKMMIRDAKKQKEDAPQSRQVREALFLKKVAENEKRRRERSRQWQVDLVGEGPVCEERRREVLEEREEAWHQYMVQRKVIREEKDVYFGKPILSNERVVLDLGQTPDIQPQFQFYPCINWDLKRRCLRLFQQAACKIVIRCRVNRRLASLRELIKEMKEPPATQQDPGVAQCVETSPPKVFLSSYPTVCEEVDSLALALSPLPVVPNGWTVSTSVPTFKLKVPQRYKLMGYTPVSTLEAYTSYIPTTLAKPLRSLPTLSDRSMLSNVQGEAESQEEHKQNRYKFTAPDFKPMPAHPLHIFNPAPGLHAHHPNPKYLESDPEYDLCALPTYHQQQLDEASALSVFNQDHLEDKEVIEKIMTWKKDFGTVLSDCLSKRRSQTHLNPPGLSMYNKEILPPELPYLKELPDELKHLKDKPPTEPAVYLTPEMVRAEMLKLCKTEVPIPSSAELKKQLRQQCKKEAKK